jgi:ABC-type glutathione transport system ATPase component
VIGERVERIVLRSRHVDITLRGSAFPEGQGTVDASSPVPSTLHLPWMPTSASARKGITWKPSAQTNLDPAASEALLIAIARARSWMNDLTNGRVTALDHADFDLYPGEILAVIGDNGAGKSSLIKALCGAVVPDSGEIRLAGQAVHFRSPIDAREAGIETVYQNLALSPALSIADNMFEGARFGRQG